MEILTYRYRQCSKKVQIYRLPPHPTPNRYSQNTHVKVEELEYPLVRDDVKHVTSGGVNDGQTMDLVVDEQPDRLVQGLIGADGDERAVLVLQEC